jgi:hypothetical protein
MLNLFLGQLFIIGAFHPGYEIFTSLEDIG